MLDHIRTQIGGKMAILFLSKTLHKLHNISGYRNENHRVFASRHYLSFNTYNIGIHGITVTLTKNGVVDSIAYHFFQIKTYVNPKKLVCHLA